MKNPFVCVHLIVVLAGGTGSVKLVRGIAASTRNLTVISNVGDNIWLYGLYICPDIDTIVYGLAGLLDEKRGWGVTDDSFKCLQQLKDLGGPSWFGLGDRDLATHLLRTNMLRSGYSLSKVTELFRRRYRIPARIIPATDDEVTTTVIASAITNNKTSKDKSMHLQEFWVKHRGKPAVKGVHYRGIRKAHANRKAIDAIKQADLIIVAPANPVSSIGPIVALKELQNELSLNRSKVVAVSPLIGRQPLSGPAAKYMKAIGLPVSPIGVAKYYRNFVGKFVISTSDHWLADKIQDLGMQVYETNITMKNRQGEIRLARYILGKVMGNR